MIISAGTIYTLIKLEKIPTPTKGTWKLLAIFIGCLVALGFLIWLIRFIIRKIRGAPLPNLPPEKEIVPTYKAVTIWTQEFILKTNISYRVDPVEGILPINRKAIIIRNEKSFPDERGQTPDRFIGFEAVVTEGDRPGIHVIIIRNDLGEKHIRENWNQYIADHRSMNMMPMKFAEFPRSSAADFDERLRMRALDMYEEGYSSEDIQMAMPSIEKKTKDNITIVPIASPKVSESVEVVSNDDSDDDDEEESPDKDASEYRNR